MQAVILAAGKGTRLRPLTNTVPKPLIEICGKVLLERVFESMPDAVTELIVVVGYLRGQIEERFGDSWRGKPIRWVIQDPLDGTAGALHRCRPFLHGRFLVVNGDDLYQKDDLTRLIQEPLGILVQETDKSLYASAIIENGVYRGLRDGQSAERSTRVCGAYALDERVFDYPPVEIQVREYTEFGLPQTLLALSQAVPIKAVHAKSWIPVGTPDELAFARSKCG